jgi:hypothetical protein
MPEHQARALLLQVEEIELLAELAMIAFLGLLELRCNISLLASPRQ